MFIKVNTVSEYPRANARPFVLNTDEVVSAVQEWRAPNPIGFDDIENFDTVQEQFEYSIPVVHLYLKFNLQGIDEVSETSNKRNTIQVPDDRPTEIWVDGTLDTVLSLLSTGVSGELLSDYTKQVDIDLPDSPADGDDLWILPEEWKGRRLRFYRNGILFNNYTIAIKLLGGSVFLGTVSQPGFEEVLTASNY